MTDRPILFSSPMIRALLDGRKTQTRRVFKPQPTMHAAGDCSVNGHLGDVDFLMRDVAPRHWVRFAVGDRLWVREHWRSVAGLDDRSPAEIGRECLDEGFDRPWCPVEYVADGARSDSHHWDGEQVGRFRQGTHMPRWMSRLTLTVTDVRVQRLQEIDGADAEAEGVFRHIAEHSIDKIFRSERSALAVQRYAELWDSLNAERGFGWATNPWVVAVSFSMARDNIDGSVVGSQRP